ncbi:hypothetical protein [Sphingomonas sp. SORGH_AS_0742]|uniref:hypothetical protein n=1 Tax=Sphingomonas sp. SORGH_AS_0742 TaxID=3041797 RepID=UPI00285C9692|nr:hypothetical protein [Sphingomonas sp. SORGH_AS_0742]MDR6151393.1 hypothetical protein [Sphingomonas sp. SORGH_AS_0742]
MRIATMNARPSTNATPSAAGNRRKPARAASAWVVAGWVASAMIASCAQMPSSAPRIVDTIIRPPCGTLPAGTSRSWTRTGTTNPIAAKGTSIPALPASTCCVLSHTDPILTVILLPFAPSCGRLVRRHPS